MPFLYVCRLFSSMEIIYFALSCITREEKENNSIEVERNSDIAEIAQKQRRRRQQWIQTIKLRPEHKRQKHKHTK